MQVGTKFPSRTVVSGRSSILIHPTRTAGSATHVLVHPLVALITSARRDPPTTGKLASGPKVTSAIAPVAKISTAPEVVISEIASTTGEPPSPTTICCRKQLALSVQNFQWLWKAKSHRQYKKCRHHLKPVQT